MAKVVFPASDLLRGFGKIESVINDRRRELLNLLGVALMGAVARSFQQKGRGGAGMDGITWRPLDPETIKRKNRRGKRNEKRTHTKGGKARPGVGSNQIGVDKGLLRASGQPGYADAVTVNGELSVTVGYSMEYAKYFDAERTLIPEIMPKAYQDALDETAQSFLDKYVKGELV